MIAFNHKDLTNDLAYIVENVIIQDAILKQLDAVKDNVTVKYDCQVSQYDLPSADQDSDHLPEVHLSNGEKLQARLLVEYYYCFDLCKFLFICRLEPMVSNLFSDKQLKFTLFIGIMIN